jgi:hypothetical protein
VAALNIFEEYCSELKLSINVSKTKIVVFSKRKYNNKKEILLNNEEVEVKDSYTYLGLLSNYNGQFSFKNSKWLTEFSLKYSSKSLRYKASRKRDNFSTCLTPVSQGKK